MEVRHNMAIASTYAGLAFATPLVGYVHAISHRLGERYHVPHGLANGVVLPHVLEVSLGGAEKRMAEMARATGVAASDSSDADHARAVIDAVRQLGADVGIPGSLDAIQAADVTEIAKGAMKECHFAYAPPKYLSRRECEALITRLLSD